MYKSSLAIIFLVFFNCNVSATVDSTHVHWAWTYSSINCDGWEEDAELGLAKACYKSGQSFLRVDGMTCELTSRGDYTDTYTAEVSGVCGPKLSCEEKVRGYMNDLFIERKHIQDEFKCSPPKSDCFHRFFLESSTYSGGDTYFASYDRNQGYSTSEIFRVTVDQACEIVKVSDDSN